MSRVHSTILSNDKVFPVRYLIVLSTIRMSREHGDNDSNFLIPQPGIMRTFRNHSHIVEDYRPGHDLRIRLPVRLNAARSQTGTDHTTDHDSGDPKDNDCTDEDVNVPIAGISGTLSGTATTRQDDHEQQSSG